MEIQTFMLVIREKLLKHGLISANHVCCKNCVSNPEICEKLKTCFQQLINQGTVQARPLTKDEKVATLEIPYPMDEVQIQVTPLIIQVHASFHFKSTKYVPWRFEPTIYM